MDENGNPIYKVAHLNKVTHQIHELSAKAKIRGKASQLVDALNTIFTLCCKKPAEWGDPVYRTQFEGGMVYRGMCQPLVVQYAVFEKERSVLILSVKPFPGGGLED